MKLTMSKNAARAITTAAAYAEYLAETDALQTAIIEAMMDEYDLFMAECEAEAAALEASIIEAARLDELWKELQTMDRNDPLYSDLYKDVYGVRPRW